MYSMYSLYVGKTGELGLIIQPAERRGLVNLTSPETDSLLLFLTALSEHFLMLSKPKSRKIAAILALAGVAPLPLFGVSLHLAGLHKFYLGQKWWGVLYMLFAFTPMASIAGVIEAVWYLIQDPDEFDQNFNDGLTSSGIIGDRVPVVAEQVVTIADAMRHLDELRQDGLITEYEFEQKRRQLLDRIR